MPKYNMQSITITTPPSSTPITAAALKSHLRLNTADEDDQLLAWITAATDLYQTDTGEVLVPTGYRLSLDYWPCTGTIFLPVYPVTAVASVQYLDTTGTWQTLTGTSTDTASTPARVVLPATLPSLHATQLPNVRVNFTAGYTTPPALPAQVVKLIASMWYENRASHEDANLKEIPSGWGAVCAQRRLNVYGQWNKGANAGR